jgi:hypothetical protein
MTHTHTQANNNKTTKQPTFLNFHHFSFFLFGQNGNKR